MDTTAATSVVYINVIKDVVNKVREEFVKYGGPGEGLLNELQEVWEMKMIQAGILSGPIDMSSTQRPTPGRTHDMNVPYEGTEEYETPTAEMLFPPTPLQTPLPTPLPGTADNSTMYNIHTGSSDYPTPGTENGSNADIKGRPGPYMDIVVPSSGKRKRDDSSAHCQNDGSIPQQDGANDALPKANLEGDTFCITFVGDIQFPRDVICSSSKIPQVDGPTPEPYDERLSAPNIYSYQRPNEDFNEGRTPAPNDDEEQLNEDDDDDELDGLEIGEVFNTQHLVLAKFDKVSRTKSKWKCDLKDGVMYINNKNILFNKAFGEFDF